MTDYFLRTSTKSNMESCLIAAGVATRNASGDIIGQWDGGRVDLVRDAGSGEVFRVMEIP